MTATLGNEGVARSNDGVAELGAGTCHETMIDRFFRGCSECNEINAEHPDHIYQPHWQNCPDPRQMRMEVDA